MNPLEAESKHAQGEAWASLREWKTDIERIAKGGCTLSELDAFLVRKVFCCILGDMCIRESETEGGG